MPQDHDPNDSWRLYPVERETMPVLEPVPAHTNCVLNNLFKLQQILWKISNNPFEESIEQFRATKKEMADTFNSSLAQWALGLPECLTNVKFPNSTPTPAIVGLQ